MLINGTKQMPGLPTLLSKFLLFKNFLIIFRNTISIGILEGVIIFNGSPYFIEKGVAFSPQALEALYEIWFQSVVFVETRIQIDYEVDQAPRL